jgi:hypothetical protein
LEDNIVWVTVSCDTISTFEGWFITDIRIVEFLNFIHQPVFFKKLELLVSRTESFLIFRCGAGAPTLIMRTRLEKDLQQMTHCSYNIPYECWRSCTRETGRLLAVQLCEHRHNLRLGLLEKSKLAPACL